MYLFNYFILFLKLVYAIVPQIVRSLKQTGNTIELACYCVIHKVNYNHCCSCNNLNEQAGKATIYERLKIYAKR